METLLNILLDAFCFFALFASLYYLPKTSDFLKNKFPKGKDIFSKIALCILMLSGALSLLLRTVA